MDQNKGLVSTWRKSWISLCSWLCPSFQVPGQQAGDFFFNRNHISYLVLHYWTYI